MIVEIPIQYIDDSPFQDRISYDEEYIAELAENIEQNTLLQVPAGRLVMESGEPALDHYYNMIAASVGDEVVQHFAEYKWRVQLAFGHNRRRAFAYLKRDTMPVDLKPLTDEQMSAHAWSENYNRKQLNAIEEARGIERRMVHFSWTQEEASEKLGLGRSTVANKLRLLKLPEDILQHVAGAQISERVAMALVPLYAMPAELEAMIPFWQKRSMLWGDELDAREGLVKKAIAGVSSDEIRRDADRMLESLTKLAQIARHCPPVLYVREADIDGMHVASYPGMMHGTQGRKALIRTYAQLSMGGLGPGDVRRFFFTGFIWGSTTGGSAWARELLSEDEFEARDHAEVEFNRESGYGKPIQVQINGGEAETYYAGHEIHVYATEDESEACNVSLVGREPKKVSTADAPISIDDELEIEDVDDEEDKELDVVHSAEATVSSETDEVDESAPEAPETSPAEGFPIPVELEIFRELPKRTIQQLKDIYSAHRHPLWNRHGRSLTGLGLKGEILAVVQDQIRYHSTHRAAYEMTDDQVEVFGAWLEELMARRDWDWQRKIPHGVAMLAADLNEAREAGILSGSAWTRYRRDLLRRVASFVYYLFLEDLRKGAVETRDDRYIRIRRDRITKLQAAAVVEKKASELDAETAIEAVGNIADALNSAADELESEHQEAADESAPPPDVTALEVMFKQATAWMQKMKPRDVHHGIREATLIKLRSISEQVLQRSEWEDQTTGEFDNRLDELMVRIGEATWELEEKAEAPA